MTSKKLNELLIENISLNADSPHEPFEVSGFGRIIFIKDTVSTLFIQLPPFIMD